VIFVSAYGSGSVIFCSKTPKLLVGFIFRWCADKECDGWGRRGKVLRIPPPNCLISELRPPLMMHYMFRWFVDIGNANAGGGAVAIGNEFTLNVLAMNFLSGTETHR